MGLLRNLLILMLIISLAACSSPDDSSLVFRHGNIIDVDKQAKKILVDDADYGPIWVDISKLSKPGRFHVPLEVTVWLKGKVKESNPQEGEAEKVEIVK